MSDANLADRPLLPAPGEGLVARFGSAVLVSFGSDDDDLVDRLLDVCEAVGGDVAPGRRLARAIAGILVQQPPEAVVTFCAFAPTEDGLAAVVCGDAELAVEGGRGSVVVAVATPPRGSTGSSADRSGSSRRAAQASS